MRNAQIHKLARALAQSDQGFLYNILRGQYFQLKKPYYQEALYKPNIKEHNLKKHYTQPFANMYIL